MLTDKKLNVPSFTAQMSDQIAKIGSARNLVETIRMAHYCGESNAADVYFVALEDVARMASNQLQDALAELEQILKTQDAA